MMFVVKARSFLRNFFLSRRVEADLDQEVHSHLEMLTEENIRAGMPPQEAQRIARIELGGVELVKEQIRDQQIGNWLLSVLSDCRYGLQQLRKNPGFTAVAVLTLALGIGANTAIFSLVDALILRELPVFKPRQLVQIATADAKGECGGISLPMFLAIQQYQPQFSELFGWWGNGIFNVEFKHEYSTADIWAVTGNFYSSLGVAPYLGRLIEPDDVDLRGVTSPRAAVMGYEFWQRHYAGDPAVIGSIVRIAGHPFTIIGVTRQWFTAMTVGPVPDITVPLNAKALIEEGRSLDDRSS